MGSSATTSPLRINILHSDFNVEDLLHRLSLLVLDWTICAAIPRSGQNALSSALEAPSGWLGRQRQTDLSDEGLRCTSGEKRRKSSSLPILALESRERSYRGNIEAVKLWSLSDPGLVVLFRPLRPHIATAEAPGTCSPSMRPVLFYIFSITDTYAVLYQATPFLCHA
jgi:hypothetical protein